MENGNDEMENGKKICIGKCLTIYWKILYQNMLLMALCKNVYFFWMHFNVNSFLQVTW